jgi:hypothetical protein
VNEYRKQARGWNQHFLGFQRRVNCEGVPRLPAAAVRWVLDDPRKTPYLFLWRRDGRVTEVVRVEALPGGPQPVRPNEEWVSITRPIGQTGCVHALQLIRRPLPRNGGEDLLLLCPRPLCGKASRYLYAWEVVGRNVVARPWQCRSCAGLRYQSEGTYVSREWRGWGGYPRPESWDPYVFSSLGPAAAWLSGDPE